jgi:hypothetical protein
MANLVPGPQPLEVPAEVVTAKVASPLLRHKEQQAPMAKDTAVVTEIDPPPSTAPETVVVVVVPVSRDKMLRLKILAMVGMVGLLTSPEGPFTTGLVVVEEHIEALWQVEKVEQGVPVQGVVPVVVRATPMPVPVKTGSVAVVVVRELPSNPEGTVAPALS